MTKLQSTKPLIRETAVYERTSALIVALHPKYLSIRLKGESTAVEIDYQAILDLARKLDYRGRAAR
jgi:hypothetical protein